MHKIGPVLTLLLVLGGCASSTEVPPELAASQVDIMGERVSAHLIKRLPRLKDQKKSEKMACVLRGLVAGLGDEANWEPIAFEGKEADAFALPGRKVFVSSGLLTQMKSSDDLAVVLGHEMAHVIANHAGRRIKREFEDTAIARLLEIAETGPKDKDFAKLSEALGLASPTASAWLEKEEKEADMIGLLVVGRGGFDPRGFSRLAEGSLVKGRHSSLHKSSKARAEGISQRLDEAFLLSEKSDRKKENSKCRF